MGTCLIPSACPQHIKHHFGFQEQDYALADQIHEHLEIIYNEQTKAQASNSQVTFQAPRSGIDYFRNWGLNLNYPILSRHYAIDHNNLGNRNQVNDVVNYVNMAVKNGKKVRGCGMAHSWSNVFTDPGNYLVVFYPETVLNQKSDKLVQYSVDAKNFERDDKTLMFIGKVGQIAGSNGEANSLVKIGAGVSNNQLRIWSKSNNLQYRSNTLMIEMNFVGALGTCSHGAGMATQTLADYVREIEFINVNGERQIISYRNQPHLIKSAASSLGLLGLIIYVTIQMQPLQMMHAYPRVGPSETIIPKPDDQSPEGQAALKQFIQATKATYCEWFYFPAQGNCCCCSCKITCTCCQPSTQTYQNVFKAMNLTPNIKVIPEYPNPEQAKKAQFLQSLADLFTRDILPPALIQYFFKSPFIFFPKPENKDLYIYYPDAVHMLRGVQNFHVHDFEAEIGIPADQYGNPDYNLIQQIWWAGLEFTRNHRNQVNVALEMRLMKGSDCTLAPQKGMDYVCSIEILQTLGLDADEWRETIIGIFEVWKSLRTKDNKPVTIRPHWGKQWNAIEPVKNHVLQDKQLLENFKKFYVDYSLIAQIGKWNPNQGLKTFSNEIYSEIIKKAIGQ